MHTKHLLPTILLGSLLSGTAGAATIAATTFDGRTATGNTASGLNWNLDGVEDPGNMSANQFEGGPINLFNNTGDVQNRFVPGINTGNGNTSWVTEVSLTKLPGAYTLVLRGGDFLDQDETGNHTGIDNLSINGSLTGGGGLAITAISLDPESNLLSLTWASAPDQTYTIQYSPDLVDWAGELETGYPADAGESTTQGDQARDQHRNHTSKPPWLFAFSG